MNLKLAAATLALVASVGYLIATRQQPNITRFDFEDGTAMGWTTVEGDLGKQPSNNDIDRHGSNFGKRGKYFIGTYEFVGDDGTGTIRSPSFTINSDMITMLVGGGRKPGVAYVALVRDSDGKELFAETGSDSETMYRAYWNVSSHVGEKVHFVVVDHAKGAWAHINVDDLGEMSRIETQALEKETVRKETERKAWYDGLLRPAARTPYLGSKCADLTMQLGGIGAGSIAIGGDGKLRKWQIFNKVNPACVVPGQMFAIHTSTGSRVLQLSPEGGLPGVAEVEFYGEFPIAELRYIDHSLPVQVSMQALSPFIPLDSENSSLPGIYFTFKVHNPGKQTQRVDLLSTMLNSVGYDGESPIQGVRNRSFGANDNERVVAGNLVAVDMRAPGLSGDAPQNGTMTLGCLDQSSTTLTRGGDLKDVWQSFFRNGSLPQQSSASGNREGQSWIGAVKAPIILKPGQTKSLTFVITWHFPNWYADYHPGLKRYRIGHYYNRQFPNAFSVAQYMAQNQNRLTAETTAFRDAFFDTTLPYWMARRLIAPATTLVSQSSLWLEDGTFAAFEGAGCCPMNCTHVYNYEQLLGHLFPDLERIMRETDLSAQLLPSGGVRHRTNLPLNAPRDTGPFVDGQLGTILKAYREHLQSADGAWLHQWWSRVKKALDFVVRDWDPNKDGVLVNEQWNTYDAAMYGPNTFIGTLYLAALLAGEKMALIENDPTSAAEYRKLFTTGSQRLNDTLWNGEYYVQISERSPGLADWITQDWPTERAEANRPYGTGCHIDQLLGVWWADQLDLDPLLPEDRVNTTLSSLFKYNWREDFGRVPQQRYFAGEGDRGLLICTWPKGGRPAQPILYADETWTGTDYEIAGMLMRRDRLRESFQIVKAIDDRYDGVRRAPIERSPWNEIECGDNYARAMSCWSVLTGAQGSFYDGPASLLRFAPVTTPNDHRSFFSTAEGWGTFSQKIARGQQVVTLTCRYGVVRVRQLEVKTQFKQGLAASGVLRISDGWARAAFPTPVVLRKGQSLTLTLR